MVSGTIMTDPSHKPRKETNVGVRVFKKSKEEQGAGSARTFFSIRPPLNRCCRIVYKPFANEQTRDTEIY